MGKSEDANAFIGYKILLSDLILQINETNLKLIKEILINGFIEDSNEHFNELYADLIETFEWNESSAENKFYLTKLFQNTFTFSYETYEEDGSLWEQFLLIPIKKILSTTRFGYDRTGRNALSTQIDSNWLELASITKDTYKEIENMQLVFLLEQCSG